MQQGLALAGSLLAPGAFASVAKAGERSLAFHHLHTGERLKLTYWADGCYQAECLRQIDHLLRDFRTGDCIKMDPKLLDLLYHLQSRVAKNGEFQIISAYRSPKTNAMLRHRNKHTGVAKHSLHMQGKAIDIRLPGVALKHLRQAAMSLKAGGVGYYPRSNFIHVDTGRVRHW